MAVVDEYIELENDDIPEDGYFNGIKSLPGLVAWGLTVDRNDATFTFATDEATTSTNFEWDSLPKDYTVIGTNAGVLIMPVTDIDTYANPQSKGWIKWDHYKFTVYDECNNSSWDTSLWDSSGTPTENTEKMTLSVGASTTANITTDATNGDVKGNDIYALKSEWLTQSSDVMRVQVTDGSTDVTVYTKTDTGGHTTRTNHFLKFDSVNEEVHVWENGGMDASSPFDLSSLGANWYIRVEITTWSSPATVRTLSIYYLRKITGSETSTVVEQLSSNNGTNYTTASEKWVLITAAQRGYRMIPKLTCTPVAGEGVCVRRVDFQMFSEED